MSLKMPTQESTGALSVLADTDRSRAQTLATPHKYSVRSVLVKPWLTTLVFVMSDVLALLAAGIAAGLLWPMINPAVGPGLFFQLWPVLAVFLLAYAVMGLYPGPGVGPIEEFKRLSGSTTVVFLTSVVALFLTSSIDGQSRGIYLGAWILTLVLVPLVRALLRHLFVSQKWWGVPIIVMGAGRTGRMLVDKLRANPGLGFKVVACLDDDPKRFGTIDGIPVFGPLDKASQLAHVARVQHVILAMPHIGPQRLRQLIRQHAASFPNILVVPDLVGMTSLGVSARDLAGMVGLHSRQNLLIPFNRVLKRALDLVLIAPLGLVALPLVVLAALAIMVVSRGSPFYAQMREGYGGKAIRVWKLRTMHLDADALLARYLQENPEAQVEWEMYYKLKNDPRILPGIGHLLRKTSLDELPQLWNVLLGNMSLVGSRLFSSYYLEGFNREFREYRMQVPPGITGIWQVSARSDGDLTIQEELDSYYIRNWSIWFDIYLLVRTPWAVFFGKGAY